MDDIRRTVGFENKHVRAIPQVEMTWSQSKEACVHAAAQGVSQSLQRAVQFPLLPVPCARGLAQVVHVCHLIPAFVQGSSSSSKPEEFNEWFPDQQHPPLQGTL